MKSVVRRKLEMATRVREFSRAHPSDDPSHEVVLAKLEERIARADVLITQQRAGLVAVHAASARRLELKRALQFQLLRYLSRVGEAAAKVKPELAMKFALPSLDTAQKPWLSSAKAMLALAEGEREFLLSVGLSELALTDLKSRVGELETAIETIHSGRVGHVGASSSLDDVTAEVMELVGILDGYNRHRFRDDSELMSGWESARRVPGPFRSKGDEPEAGSGPVEPPVGGGLAPAA